VGIAHPSIITLVVQFLLPKTFPTQLKHQHQTKISSLGNILKLPKNIIP